MNMLSMLCLVRLKYLKNLWTPWTTSLPDIVQWKRMQKTLAQDHVLTAELIERLIERIEIDHERNIHVTFRFKNEFQGKAVEPCATM